MAPTVLLMKFKVARLVSAMPMLRRPLVFTSELPMSPPPPPNPPGPLSPPTPTLILAYNLRSCLGMAAVRRQTPRFALGLAETVLVTLPILGGFRSTSGRPAVALGGLWGQLAGSQPSLGYP